MEFGKRQKPKCPNEDCNGFKFTKSGSKPMTCDECKSEVVYEEVECTTGHDIARTSFKSKDDAELMQARYKDYTNKKETKLKIKHGLLKWRKVSDV